MFDGMSENECELLTDYIISVYLPFDKDALLSYYASYDDMMMAMRSTVGGEYDIKEIFNSGSDRIYVDMSDYVHDELRVSPVRNVIAFSDEYKLEVAGLLASRFGVRRHEMSKFLHLKLCGR